MSRSGYISPGSIGPSSLGSPTLSLASSGTTAVIGGLSYGGTPHLNDGWHPEAALPVTWVAGVAVQPHPPNEHEWPTILALPDASIVVAAVPAAIAAKRLRRKRR